MPDLRLTEQFAEILGSTADPIDLRVIEVFAEVLGTTADPIDLRVIEQFAEVLGSTADIASEVASLGASAGLIAIVETTQPETVIATALLGASASIDGIAETVGIVEEIAGLGVAAGITAEAHSEFTADLDLGCSASIVAQVAGDLTANAALPCAAGLIAQITIVQPSSSGDAHSLLGQAFLLGCRVYGPSRTIGVAGMASLSKIARG